MLNLMLDALLDFRAIAVLTSILLPTTTLASTWPLSAIHLPFSSSSLNCPHHVRKNGPACDVRQLSVCDAF